MDRVDEALVKATSTVQQLIRVTMALQQGRATGTDAKSAAAVRSRELQVMGGRRVSFCDMTCETYVIIIVVIIILLYCYYYSY